MYLEKEYCTVCCNVGVCHGSIRCAFEGLGEMRWRSGYKYGSTTWSNDLRFTSFSPGYVVPSLRWKGQWKQNEMVKSNGKMEKFGVNAEAQSVFEHTTLASTAPAKKNGNNTAT